MQGGSSSSRLIRNLKERNRRMTMTDLYSRLSLLIPDQHSKVSVGDLLFQATTYIKQLEKRVEQLKRRKNLLGVDDENIISRENLGETGLPILDMSDTDSLLHINIVCGSNKNFTLHEVIRVVEEEGAQVTSSTYQHGGARIFYTIQCQAICPRIGIETSRVQERLKKLVA